MLALCLYEAEIEALRGCVACPQVAQLGNGPWASNTCYLSRVWKSGCLHFSSLWILLLWKAKSQGTLLCGSPATESWKAKVCPAEGLAEG